MTLSAEHLDQLRQAKALLEKPRVAARFTHVLAQPVEKGMALLPAAAREQIVGISEASIRAALALALSTLGNQLRPSSNLTHKAAVAVSGAAGGAFGLAALAAELPVSTAIMLRSIADIARSEGEDLTKAETRIACLEVFALGGADTDDDGAETGYFAVRAALAKAVSEAASYAATSGAARESAPALVRLVGHIAARFSLPVTEKAAAQAVPVLGAAGGAMINILFMAHFQDAARGHFVVRRLERRYGADKVRMAYAAVSDAKRDG